jgi:molecular chaperone DnaK (HSP70)
MNQTETVVGIDLGTTNSEVAAFSDHRVAVLGPADKMLPSCVGLSPAGQLLIGQPARNQQLLYPERTVRSIKRKMGSSEAVTLGDKTFTPPEISALILRELVAWAGRELKGPVERAVITVPAYFSDAQRNATREAGAIAGLEVLRILNEPTAASLAYGLSGDRRQTVMVYDLGGGTFDVSIVTIEGDVTEVLASHGNNHLGGDDFNDLLLERLCEEFEGRYRIDPRPNAGVRSRLWLAAEEAKKKLSFEPYARLREEAVILDKGRPLHLNMELAREEYEAMISPLVETTLDSVSRALADARKTPGDIDAILLVGGSTRTPLVSRLLRERTGIEPRQEIHPDLCVALGAGVLASRLAGHAVERVLVDVSPFSFGPSYLGERNGEIYPHCYHPVIHRNTPLPVTRTERYQTAAPCQTTVDVKIYQGDDDDALKNILVGEFHVHGLRPVREPNEVLCKMSLDVDGILHVTAIEKATGKSKHVKIANALRMRSAEEIAQARDRLEELCSARAPGPQDSLTGAAAGNAGAGEDRAPEPQIPESHRAARQLIERSRRLLDSMHAEDKEEAIGLHERIETAIAAGDEKELDQAVHALSEFLFFVEGK